MHLSTHYYVLSLGIKTNLLFEAFRDTLILVENQGFPIETEIQVSHPSQPGYLDLLRQLAHTVDEYFGRYFMQEPLRLVIVGEKEMQLAFSAETSHASAIVGYVEGDHSETGALNLGKIVWPIVKGAMSGVLVSTMLDLEACAKRGELVFGLEAVARIVDDEAHSTLLVEDDYHVRGSIRGIGNAPILSPDVDVREVIDDAVDAIVEKVLKTGGNVVFTPAGSLHDLERIALLPNGAERN